MLAGRKPSGASFPSRTRPEPVPNPTGAPHRRWCRRRCRDESGVPLEGSGPSLSTVPATDLDQIVSLCNVGQFIFAGIMAWFLFNQVPPASFYLASALVVTGVSIVVFAAPSPPPRLR